MYCKNCGKLLDEGDKFCSNCGTKVEKEFVPDFKKRQQEAPQEAEEERPKKSFHIEEFNWDLEGYPTDNRKTEDVDFNWESVLDDRQRSRRGEEPEERSEREGFVDPVKTQEEPVQPVTGQKTGDADSGESDPVQKSAEDGGKLDKFFTFNKKNEEFQALLDQEYEKIKNGEGGSDDETVSQVASKDDTPCFAAENETPFRQETEETGDDSEEAVAVMLSSTPDGIIVEKTSLTEEPALSPSRRYPPSGPEEKAGDDAKKEQQSRLTFDDVFGHDDIDEAPKKKHRALKVIAIILCVLIILELIIIGIQYFAPDSAAGKLINDSYSRILEFFSGGEEDAEPAAAPADDTSAIKSLIEGQKDKNENIAVIDEDSQLVFEDGKDYGFEEFQDSYTFSDESWYTGDDGEPVTYGEEIVGTLIAYYSAWVDKMNSGDNEILSYVDDTSEFYTETADLTPEEGVQYGVNRLSIGEIRSGNAGFYIMTAVTRVDSGTNEETTENQVVYMEPEQKAMKIVSIKKI